jgi:AcrR family transcriptional regulator
MPKRAARTKSRKTHHHGDLRRALIAATLDIVAVHGVHAVSVREVARRAGVSSGAPYRHFADKASLLAAVAEEGFLWLGDQLQAAAASVSDPNEMLAVLGAAYVGFAEDHPAHFRVMYAPEVSGRDAYPPLQAAWNRAFGMLRDTMMRNTSAPGASTSMGALLALGPWTMVHGLATLALDGQLRSLALPTTDGREIFRMLVALQREYRKG